MKIYRAKIVRPTGSVIYEGIYTEMECSSEQEVRERVKIDAMIASAPVPIIFGDYRIDVDEAGKR